MSILRRVIGGALAGSVATAAASVEHEGRTYYFCGKGCAKGFSADPGKYTKAVVS